MRDPELIQRVEKSIRERCLLAPRQRVLVAVSGGLDSMVLLDLLERLAAWHGWRLTIAHFNHQLRGRSSEADERFVKRAAVRRGLDCVAGRGDVRKHARQRGVSMEMAARKLRHDFLARTARRLRIPVIAVAHHADDQVELFFLRVLRGSGGEGLAGMKWRNPSPSDPAIELVRPLLDIPKSALRDFARKQGIAFREDNTNAQRDILRNRIRHELCPWMGRTFGESFRQTIARLMEIVGAEAELVGTLASQWSQSRTRSNSLPGANPQSFAQLPVAIQRRCLQLQFRQQGLDPDFDLVERIRLAPEIVVSLGSRLWVKRDAFGGLILVRRSTRVSSDRKSGAKSLRVWLRGRNLPRATPFRNSTPVHRAERRSGEVAFGGTRFGWGIVSRRGAGLKGAGRGFEFFDADKVGAVIRLRHWWAGDRFQPIGRRSPVKLQDLFTNAKIPRAERHRLVIAEASNGEIFWVENLRIGERFKLDKHTVRRLKWSWQRATGRELRPRKADATLHAKT